MVKAFTAGQYKQLEELTRNWKLGQCERDITITAEFNQTKPLLRIYVSARRANFHVTSMPCLRRIGFPGVIRTGNLWT
ncbi:MAG: hypothetical protein OEU48_05665, partial [Gammaproteobacteria bacterium]|nr:hypothetical protein [Gammaproteobacteria bacterium]